MSLKGQQLGAREAMLGRIRRALLTPSPQPHKSTVESGGATDGAVSRGLTPSDNLPIPIKPGSASHEGEAQGSGVFNGHSNGTSIALPMLDDFKRWLPPVGESWEEQADLFARNSQSLTTEFSVLQDIAELRDAMRDLAADNGWNLIASHRGELCDAALEELELAPIWVDEGYDKGELAACDAGISQCDALIAQTGSVLVCTQSAGGRALSVLPPHHIVIARRDQLVPDLPAAFHLMHEKYGDAWPSSASFITGPSRTGDIERILVLGAHGPKKLTVFCV
jgi:L-lactate dehydrogenase complex protein LldG